MPREEFTREQLARGEGLFTSGEWTLIWRRPDGTHFTTSRHDQVIGATLAGGGRRAGGAHNLVCVEWCDE
jgi:hypothetical protein